MEKIEMREPSEKLMELIFFALDHGMNCVRESTTLIPFLVTQGEERNLERFVTERIEDGLTKAQKAASTLDTTINQYAIVYDGYITIESTKYDAIFVEAAERGVQTGFRFAQRYSSKKGLPSRFKTIGNAVFLGEAEQRFT